MNVLPKAMMTCLFLSSFCAAQTTYVFTTFQNPGATITRVFGLNGHGELVGGDNTLPGRHAFLVNRNDYSVLDTSGILGTHISFARGINNAGDIVGGYFDDDGNEHGFLLHHDVLTTIDVPFVGSVGTQLNSLNDSGTIVGVWVGRRSEPGSDGASAGVRAASSSRMRASARARSAPDGSASR